MTNREKYAEQILDIACNGHCIALDKETMKLTNCGSINYCSQCYFNTNGFESCSLKCQEWCESEYTEPPVDWSKVPVDTPILVRDSKNDEWIHRHFAKFEDDYVYAWDDGQTSWSSLNTVDWKYAKLAKDEA